MGIGGGWTHGEVMSAICHLRIAQNLKSTWGLGICFFIYDFVVQWDWGKLVLRFLHCGAAQMFFFFLLFPSTSSIYHDISTINPTTRLYYTRLRLGGTLYDFWAQTALHGVARPTWERWRRSEMSAGTPAQRSRRFRMLVTRDPWARGKESGI